MDLVVLLAVSLASRRYGLNAENDEWPIVIDAAINIIVTYIIVTFRQPAL